MILALDQSTSATKAMLFDPQGRQLDRESLGHAQHYPQPGWVEHDAEEIWQNTLKVLGAVASRALAAGHTLDFLSLTNQRETIVLFSRANGQPIHRALVWQCRRGLDLCQAHLAAGDEPLVQAKTGLRLDAYFSASKLQWLVQTIPGLAARLASGEVLIGTIDTYLIYRLTAGQVFATDPTNASRTLLYDIVGLKWDPELCALWQIPPQALAEVRDCTAHFGTTTLEGLLPFALPLWGVMGDSQASLFAQGCDLPGSAKVTFGTGSSLLLNVGPTPRISSQGVVTTVAWVRQGIPTYAFEGIIISAAATLTWLRDQLGLVREVAECEALAQEVPDNGGVYLVPAFSGLGLPYWAAEARAAIVGLSNQSDRRHIARAALESISFQVRDALEAMRTEAGLSLTRLHGDGGPTSNRFLMQFTADLAGVELHVAQMSDCSALGAARAGAEGFSSPPLLSLGQSHPIIFQPRLSPSQSSALSAGWHAAVARVLPPPPTTPCPPSVPSVTV